MKRTLSREDFESAALRLGCDVAAIQAVAEIEQGPFGAFHPDGRPVILLERHLVYRFAKRRHGADIARRWAAAHPGICNPKRGGYGKSAAQHDRLAQVAKLDREIALRACSWGLFQILGDNFHAAGHISLQSFVNAMYGGADEHLAAFVAFVLSKPRLAEAMRAHDWHTFAEIYNGPDQEAHDYEGRIGRAHERIRREAA
jgi:hypothetical protein